MVEHLRSNQAIHLSIYDRWGREVYQSPDYRNDWEGQGLGNGVYYYVLREAGAGRQYRGWVQVLR